MRWVRSDVVSGYLLRRGQDDEAFYDALLTVTNAFGSWAITLEAVSQPRAGIACVWRPLAASLLLAVF